MNNDEYILNYFYDIGTEYSYNKATIAATGARHPSLPGLCYKATGWDSGGPKY